MGSPPRLCYTIFSQLYGKGRIAVQYMVIERYTDKEAVYRRFREKGRMMPAGVRYVNSWVTADGNTCYQINEADSPELLHAWAANWEDVTEFEFIPVISSQEMSTRMADCGTDRA